MPAARPQGASVLLQGCCTAAGQHWVLQVVGACVQRSVRGVEGKQQSVCVSTTQQACMDSCRDIVERERLTWKCSQGHFATLLRLMEWINLRCQPLARSPSSANKPVR